MKIRTALYGCTGAVVAAGIALAGGSTAAGASVEPEYVAGNASCQSLGYDFEFKIDKDEQGFNKPEYEVPGVGTVTLTTDGTYWSWTSTFGIDAVISKGGNAANIYRYDPPAESFGDTGMVSPDNPSGGPAGLSHVQFCYDIELQVSKTTETSWSRSYTWDVDKVGDETELLLSQGQTYDVDYDVTLGATPVDSDWAVQGEISITNPHPTATASVTGVSDTMTGGIVDECIDVTDSLEGDLGTVCVEDLPKTNSYTHQITAEECGEWTVHNVASFETNDTGATGEDDHDVAVTEECQTGCTLTQGYWKTHSEKGPAPYDETWAMLPNGADTTFFLSGKSWHEVFNTPPAGNSYYSLAHQYAAAALNELNGADTTAVSAEMAAAKTFLETYTPAQVSAAKKTLGAEATALAGVLDSYNNGLIGPGHCDE